MYLFVNLLDTLFFYILTVIIGVYIIGFSTRNFKQRNITLIFAIFSCSILVYFSDKHIIIKFSIAFICFAFFMLGYFKIKIRTVLPFCILTYCAITIMLQIVRMLFYNPYWCIVDNPELQLLLIDLTVLLITLVISFFFKGKTSEKSLSLPYMYFFTMVCIIDCSVIFFIGDYFFYEIYKLNFKKMVLVYCLVIIGIIIQMCLLIYMIYSRNIYKKSEERAKHFLEEQKKYYEYLQKKDEDTRRFRHDIRSHLYMLNSLYDKEDSTTYKKYLDEFTSNFEQISSTISVNNGIADALLNKYFYEAQQKNITLNIDGHFPNNCEISAYDICTIFSNLLDNAFDAVQYNADPQIDVRCAYNDGEIILIFENKYNQIHYDKNGQLMTHKTDSTTHGFGINNVKECIKRNHGHMIIDTSNQKFKVMVSINRRTNNENCCN